MSFQQCQQCWFTKRSSNGAYDDRYRRLSDNVVDNARFVTILPELTHPPASLLNLPLLLSSHRIKFNAYARMMLVYRSETRTGHLTPSTPAVPNCCCSKGPAPWCSNPPFLIFDIPLLCQIARMSKIENGGLDLYDKV